MRYTIKEVSEITKIPASTLRFYDKKGLLPFLKRTESGYRIFSKLDLSSLQLIECLKITGLSIDDIKKFADWVRQGNVTLPQRYEMLVEQKAAVENQIENMKKTLEIINHKVDYYQQAVDAGTDSHLLYEDKMPYADEFLGGKFCESCAVQSKVQK